MNSAEIKEVFRKHYHDRLNEVGLFEFSPGSPIFDVFMIAPHRRIFKGFEIKVSHSDFLREKREVERGGYWFGEVHPARRKCDRYLKYCHLFYYVCPEGIIQPSEIEDPAGLLWVRSGQEYQYSHFSVKKRPKRNPGPNVELSQKILFLFAARAKTRAGDYF